MMATHQGDILDPMYNFDTHFPERLSRLHVHGDTFAPSQNQFRKKKTRANRNAARYKTQPVTFDEILEVDEEPIPASASSPTVKDAEKRRSHDDRLLNMSQLQAFSKSLDGLVPPNFMPEQFKHNVMLGRSGSFSRTGSRKYIRHPECIPEKVESESQPKSPQPKQVQPRLSSHENPAQRLGESRSLDEPDNCSVNTESVSLQPNGSNTLKTNIPSPNIAPRRQKVTAKAKKRQKAQEEGEGS